jgi:alkanesulfonate monooxygenase SsuD/methylene tetrahydromethanopterin reductase-like flavin-dependent oxidoreductase (luciferase family)
MDVGVYFDLRNPPGWRQDWSRLYGFSLEAIEEAEHLGARSVWLSEHHGFEDGYLNQPLTYAAAVAARTRTVRIGTAVLIAPFWNPVQLAEEAAVIDIVSGGRLELGLGAGYRIPEFELFGVDRSRRYTLTDTAVRRVRELWADPGHLPGPVQDRVPIWMGYMGPQGARRAGRLGEGLLMLNHKLLEPYREGLAEGGHDPGCARMSGPVFAYVTEDPERDWAVVAKHHAYQMDSFVKGFVDGTAAPPPEPAAFRARGLAAGPLGLGYGTPETVAAQIRETYRDLPVQHVFFWVSLAGMPEDMVMRHVQALCSMQPLLA